MAAPPRRESARQSGDGGKQPGPRLIELASAGLTDNMPVSIRGEEVILERGGGATESGRNRLPCVVSVRPGSPLQCVELEVGFPLFAFVTRPACEELDLRPGATVAALIKAPAVHLIQRSS